jgi:hypothetical protein
MNKESQDKSAKKGEVAEMAKLANGRNAPCRECFLSAARPS